jgi:AAA domain
LAEQLQEFLTKKFTPTPHLIGRGILPAKGKLIIGGAPKTNKSWLILNLALDLVRGRNGLGAEYKSGVPVLPIHKQFKVLYVEQELGDEGLRDRLKGSDEGHPGLAAGINWEGLPFFIKTRDTAMRLDTPDGRDFINAEIGSVKPDLVIFDPLSKFNLVDENSAQETGAVLRAVDHIIEDFGCAICIIHHTSKPAKDDQREGLNRLRGSSAIAGDVDSFIEVTRLSNEHHPEPVLKLDFTLRRGEPLDSLFVQRRRTGLIEWLGQDYQFGTVRNGPRPSYRSL